MSEPDDVTLGGDLVTQASRLVRAVRRANALPASARVLSMLDQLGPSGISALATADNCSQPTMSNAVRDLAEQGWVTKRPDPDDSRAQLVELTGAGRCELTRVRRDNGRLVTERLARTTHSTADLATTVAVLRDLLADPQTTQTIQTTQEDQP